MSNIKNITDNRNNRLPYTFFLRKVFSGTIRISKCPTHVNVCIFISDVRRRVIFSVREKPTTVLFILFSTSFHPVCPLSLYFHSFYSNFTLAARSLVTEWLHELNEISRRRLLELQAISALLMKKLKSPHGRNWNGRKGDYCPKTLHS